MAWVCVRDSLLLHVRSFGSDAFYVPGGKREPGESDAEVLLREIHEELGVLLDPTSLELCCVVDAPAHGVNAGRRVRMRCYFAAPLPTSAEPLPASEIEEVRWLSRADADLTAPADVVLMDELVKRGMLPA